VNITTFLIEKEQKETLKAIADLNKTTASAILRTFIELFITDNALQNRILEGVKRNELHDKTTR
jgi:hypothetical protein